MPWKFDRKLSPAKQFLSLLLLLSLVSGIHSELRAQEYLPPMGGPGGGQFKAPCPIGQNLAGFELRAADDVDAIRPVCVTSYGPVATKAPAGPTDSPWYGGPGGRVQSLLCPAATPIVIGLDIVAEGVDTIVVNNIHLFCGRAVPSQTLQPYPSAVFDGPLAKESINIGVDGSRRSFSSHQECPSGQLAVGIHGRSGVWLDSMGLICDAPRIVAAPAGRVATLGRNPNPQDASSAPPMSICQQAADARARHSPAAPNLEAQCQASGSHVNSLGRTDPGSAAQSSGTPTSVCDAAIAARERNSSAAPSLEAECRKIGGGAALDRPTAAARTLGELATAGRAIAESDPLSAQLRALQPEGPIRRGFDIGMAASVNQTQWGPSKQKLLGSLSAAEGEGFTIAVSFSLDRNRNADLAATGATIAEAIPAIGKARTLDTDPRYWLGFDIATGIFGDPALGAKGNTATGPGSLGIRNALSIPAQRGFDASVSLNLNQKH
jgi:hypothetical protein